MTLHPRFNSSAPNFTSVWRRLFGRDSACTRDAFTRLSEIWNARDAKAVDSFRFWRAVRQTASNATLRFVAPQDRLTTFGRSFASFGAQASDVSSFILQTYLAQTILALAEGAFELTPTETFRLFGATPFDWGESIRPFLNVDHTTIKRLGLDRFVVGADLFGETYASLFSNASRSSLGEFYTPPAIAEYLRRRALEFKGVGAESNVLPAILDPTCGSGVFLTASLKGMFARDVDAVDALEALSGYDLSPFAVLTSRANLLFAATSRAPEYDRPQEARRIMRRRQEKKPNESILPVYLFDALRNCVPRADESEAPVDYFDSRRWAKQGANRRFEIALGNPPWISWDKLNVEYREATKDYWLRYGLFTLSGKEARYGGGKKELASLMLRATVDLRLVSGGILAFVLPKTLFQTQKSGDGFRRFGASQNDDSTSRIEPFCALAIDDFSELKPFRGVASKASALYARKGEKTRYPISVRFWRPRKKGRRFVDETFETRSFDEGVAYPLGNKLGAPLVFEFANEPSQTPKHSLEVLESSRRFDQDKDRCAALVERLFKETENQEIARGRSYVAKLGANAAGGSGVFWFQDRESLDAPLVAIRNLGDVGRRKVETFEATLESALLFPLLRWRDVDEFVARPTSVLALIPQDPKTRRGYELERMRRDFPNALEYLTRFETFLRERAAYKRYQSGAPFWSLYNVDESTFARYKVVWRRMDSTLRAAVVQWDQKRARPIIPQETLSLIAVESLEEADYLAAVLNSAPARKRIEAVSVASSKGFGSPSVLNAVPIPRFDPRDERLLELANYGRTRRLNNGASFDDAPDER